MKRAEMQLIVPLVGFGGLFLAEDGDPNNWEDYLICEDEKYKREVRNDWLAKMKNTAAWPVGGDFEDWYHSVIVLYTTPNKAYSFFKKPWATGQSFEDYVWEDECVLIRFKFLSDNLRPGKTIYRHHFEKDMPLAMFLIPYKMIRTSIDGRKVIVSRHNQKMVLPKKQFYNLEK